mmetsp:Transcript_10488/g.23848  ORF Transcript_10488/g.23848 Transcript_10488/m.23848 type:complete len:687 (-) Transcript_10488:53-2113(-)
MFGGGRSSANAITRSAPGSTRLQQAVARAQSHRTQAERVSTHNDSDKFNLDAGIAKEVLALHAKVDKVLLQLGTFFETIANQKGGSRPDSALPKRIVNRPPPVLTAPLPGQAEEKEPVTSDSSPSKTPRELRSPKNHLSSDLSADERESSVPEADFLQKLQATRGRVSSGWQDTTDGVFAILPITSCLKHSTTRDSGHSRLTRSSHSSRSLFSEACTDIVAGLPRSSQSQTSVRRSGRAAVAFSQETGGEMRKEVTMSAAVAAQIGYKRRRRSNVEVKVWRFMDHQEGRQRAWFPRTLDVITIFSVLSSLFDSVFEAGSRDIGPVGLQFMFDAIFISEIAIRFAVCPDRCRFFREVYNWLDLVAGFVPFALRVVALSQDEDIWYETLVCLVPALRMLKLLRRFEQFHLLTQAFGMAFEALPFLIYTLALIIFAFSTCVFLVEPRDNIPDFGTALWLSLLTASTVGYGDVVPITFVGKFMISALVVVATIYTSIPFGIVGGSFSQVWTDRDRLLLMHRTRLRLLESGIAPEDFPALFRLFDHDGDGELSLDEFAALLKQLRVNMSRRRILDLFRVFDLDESGTIDGNEFVRVLFPSTFVTKRDHTWSEDVATAVAAAEAFKEIKRGRSLTSGDGLGSETASDEESPSEERHDPPPPKRLPEELVLWASEVKEGTMSSERANLSSSEG